MHVRTLVLGAILAGGCTVSAPPPPEATRVTVPAQAMTRLASHLATASECSSYCAAGDFYCPSNPLMECYWYCTQTCVVCDGETTCYDNPPPP